VPEIQPLHGVRVLEISEGWTTPLCGKLLVDLGAHVVKLSTGDEDVVRAMGQGESRLALHMVDAGKRVVPVDDVDDQRRAALVRRADVVLGDRHLLDRLGAGVHADERTVLCVVSPFGSSGPLADHVASDLTLQAATAIMATTGEAGGPPTRAGTELGAAVGAIYGTIGVLAALVERLRSGLGQTVDVSVYDCLVSTLTQFASRVLGGVAPLPRLGNQGANSAPWNLFESSDGQFVFIIAGSDPTFTRLAQVMGQTALLHDQKFDTHIHRRENREEITAIVGKWTAQHSGDHIVESLRTAGVPVSLVATPAQVLEDPHFRSRHLLGSIRDGGEQQAVPATPLAIGSRWQGDAPAALELDSWLDGGQNESDASSRPDDQAATRQAPLAGFTVLDVGTITAGPYCARLLGNLGADVIKIEPPGGELGRHSPPLIDGESVYFHITNNGKRSVCLDLSTPEGQDHLRRLANAADVLVENLAPGSLAKRALGPKDLTAANPRLVYTSVSGFGHEGAHGGQRAYDTVVQAAGGIMGVTGEAGGKPLKTGISSADVLGALGGTAATIAALYRRERDGAAGGWLDVAMYDLVAWSTQMWWPSVFLGNTQVERSGTHHRLFAPYGSFETTDGPVALSCETTVQWQALVRLLGDNGCDVPADWATLDVAGRHTRRDEIEKVVQSYAAGESTEALVAACQAAGVPAEPVLDCPDVVNSRHAAARDLVADAHRPGKPPIRVTNFPVKLSATPARVVAGAPGVDEHGDDIRQHG
jgi:crotonobetainyl-CoA:carnitine CoA-transferase CaiB-like acyl-CoA transferase